MTGLEGWGGGEEEVNHKLVTLKENSSLFHGTIIVPMNFIKLTKNKYKFFGGVIYNRYYLTTISYSLG